MWIVTQECSNTIEYGPFTYTEAKRVLDSLWEPCGCGNPKCWINLFTIKAI